jgi:pantothenate synthetase
MIVDQGFQSVDYFNILNHDFETIDENTINKQPYCIVTAATIEKVRLIDNIII